MKITVGPWLLIIVLLNFAGLIALILDRNNDAKKIDTLELQLKVAKTEYASVFIEANKRGYISFSPGLLVSDWVETPEEALVRLSKRPRNDIDEEYHKTHPGK